jgi:phage head maturation protease
MLEVTGFIPFLTFGERTGKPYWIAIRSGACAASIAGGRVELWLGHEKQKVLARQADGTLSISETACGLEFFAYANGPMVDQLRSHHAAGEIRGLSPGFGKGECKEHWPTKHQCILTAVELLELSIVLGPEHHPVIPGTRVTLGRCVNVGR